MLGDKRLAVRHSPRLKRFYLEQNLTAKDQQTLITKKKPPPREGGFES